MEELGLFRSPNKENIHSKNLDDIMLDFKESSHWRDETSQIMVDCDGFRTRVKYLEMELEKEKLLRLSIEQDLKFANNRIASLNSEHRELRQHWMAEKNDLESRLIQLQAQVTQAFGSIRKKEKEYDRLQIQLQKLVKDSHKGSKSHIIVSKPLQKNLSQTFGANISMRDAEILTLKQVIHKSELENEKALLAMELLANKFQELEDSFNSKLMELEHEIQSQREEWRQHDTAPISEAGASGVYLVRDQLQDALSTILELEELMGAEVSPVKSSKSISTFGCTVASSLSSPVAQSAAVVGAESGPNQAALLRIQLQEAFKTIQELGSLVHQDSPADSSPVLSPLETEAAFMLNRSVKKDKSSRRRRSSCSFTPRKSLGSRPDSEALQAQLVHLRAQLEAAMLTIHEQDSLLQQALLGQLPGASVAVCELLQNQFSDIDLAEDEADAQSTMPLSLDASAGIDSSDFEKDFSLPPASPATRDLLMRCGWDHVPALTPGALPRSVLRDHRVSISSRTGRRRSGQHVAFRGERDMFDGELAGEAMPPTALSIDFLVDHSP